VTATASIFQKQVSKTSFRFAFKSSFSLLHSTAAEFALAVGSERRQRLLRAVDGLREKAQVAVGDGIAHVLVMSPAFTAASRSFVCWRH
jgi:hypothetical protein